jgi:hypothetical protein
MLLPATHTRPTGRFALSFTRCPFCEHPNLAEGKFCSECGGALHLAPCPKCGAVNQVTSSVCYQCRSPLQGRGVAAPAPSLPTDLSDLLPDSISGTVVPESLPVAVVRESSPRRRSRAIIGTVVVVAIAALGYNVYRQRSLINEPPPQAAGSEATDRAAAAGVVRRDAAVGAPNSPSRVAPARAATLPVTSLAAPAHATVDQPRTDPQPAESQRAKAAVPAAARPQAVSAGKAGPFVPEACTEAGAALGLCVMSPARKKAAETAAAVSTAIGRDPATGSRKSDGQEPARPQECTEAVAALGLCPAGITQGRK